MSAIIRHSGTLGLALVLAWLLVAVESAPRRPAAVDDRPSAVCAAVCVAAVSADNTSHAIDVWQVRRESRVHPASVLAWPQPFKASTELLI